MFFIIEKLEETVPNFSQNSVTVIWIMEMQNTVDFLNGFDNENSKFSTRKWYVFDSETKGIYSHENPIKFLTSSLESSLCDYSDAYVIVTGNITVTGGNANTKVAFKSCAHSKNAEQK